MTTAVSPALATKAATLFFTEQAPQSKSTPKTIASIRTLFAEDGTPSMYVINYVQGGFVIVSATKEYFPILAYSDENRFELNPQNGGATDWVNQTQYAINHSNELPDSTQSKIFAIWQHYDPQPQTTKGAVSKSSAEENVAFYSRISELRTLHNGYTFLSLANCSPSTFPLNSGMYEALCNYATGHDSPHEYTIIAIKNELNYTTAVAPLISTTWQQRNGFNAMCPVDCPAGCAAIAMAQIMRFHHHPAIYNWNDMPNTHATTSTQKLISDVGIAAQTLYSPTGSSSNISKMHTALTNNFGDTARRAMHNNTEVNTEIFQNRRPVLMTGITSNGVGHAWVCNGAQLPHYITSVFAEYRIGISGSYYYTSYYEPSTNSPFTFETWGPTPTRYYMNWGWGGSSDGWFSFSDVNTPSYNFNQNRENLYISK